MKARPVFSAALFLLLPAAALAYSTAEEARRHEKLQHLGYLSFAKEGQLEALKALPAPEKAARRLKSEDIEGFQIFSGTVDGKTLLFARHTLPAGECPAKAWNEAGEDKVLGPWLDAQGKLMDPAPRAAEKGRVWLPMECVFYYRGAGREPGKQARACAAITGLKPEMEMQYRTLHQTTWPGVLQTISKANIANFAIYLVDIGDKLYLLYYFDYVGDDFDADMAGVGKDPVTLRWWKHTDPCQLPLPGAKGIWTDLSPVYPAAAK